VWCFFMVRVGWYFTRLSHSSHSSFRGAGQFRSFAEAIRSLGLNRVLVGRADLRQDLRLAFKKAQQTRAVTHRGTTGKRAPAAPAAPRLHSNAGALSRSYTAH